MSADEKENIKCDTNFFIATTKEGDEWIHANKEKAHQLGLLSPKQFPIKRPISERYLPDCPSTG